METILHVTVNNNGKLCVSPNLEDVCKIEKIDCMVFDNFLDYSLTQYLKDRVLSIINEDILRKRFRVEKYVFICEEESYAVDDINSYKTLLMLLKHDRIVVIKAKKVKISFKEEYNSSFFKRLKYGVINDFSFLFRFLRNKFRIYCLKREGMILERR